MNEFLTRIISKLYRMCFVPCQGWKFKDVGKGAALFRPFRVDGGKGISIGARTVFQRGTWLYCCGVEGRNAVLSIGDGCAFGYNNHITAVGRVTVGNNVLTANNVYISDNLHDYEDITVPIMHQRVRFKREAEIGDGSWIGENACIIGARVGKNCVIGANAVVNSDIPDYSVAVGVPAVVIKQFDPQLKRWVARNT
jgi:acetyltransferase-like isoleucine patch superfamily enzyme